MFFELDGGSAAKWGVGETCTLVVPFSEPRAIAVNHEAQQVFVLDEHYLRVFLQGNRWGGHGTADGQFKSPKGVAIDSKGLIYVADTGNQRIQVFKPDGTFVRKWGGKGPHDGEFHSCVGIAISSQDEVYVVDQALSRVQVFRTDGTFLRKWGSFGPPGYHDDRLHNPTGVAIHPSGLVLVADTDNDRVQVFSADGGYTGKSLEKVASPRGIAVDPKGRVYVTCGVAPFVRIFE